VRSEVSKTVTSGGIKWFANMGKEGGFHVRSRKASIKKRRGNWGKEFRPQGAENFVPLMMAKKSRLINGPAIQHRGEGE